MADVNLNIRGRDDGAGSVVDNLREKVEKLAESQGKIRTKDIRDTVYGDFDNKRDNVRNEYREIRESSKNEFEEARRKYQEGKLSDKEYAKHQKEYDESNKELDSAERREIRDLDLEQKDILRELLEKYSNRDKEESLRRQRDDSEHDDGYREDDGMRVFVTNWPSNFNSSTSGGSPSNSNSSSSSNSSSGSYERGQFGAGMRQALMGVARGDVSGTIMGGTEMMGSLIGGKIGKAFTLTGLVAMLVKELLGQGDMVQEAIGETSSMRGGASSGASANALLQQAIADKSDILSKLGLSSDEFAQQVNNKARSSGMSGNDVINRTLDDYLFSKGFGGDTEIFSQYERFNSNGKNSASVGLDILNVLTQIERSSLKENDLSTLNEKLQSQNSIMEVQRAKRDLVNSETSLRMLASFEKIGLSDKGERGGNFLSQTIQGLSEGGSDNEMLLKYQAVRMARPDLANDPAKLRRFVKFNSDDGKYQSEFFKLVGRISGGNEMALDDILMTMFPNANEKDLDMYYNMIQNKGGSLDFLSGKGKMDMSLRNGLSLESAYEDSKSSVGTTTEVQATFGNWIKEAMVYLKGMNDTLEKGIKVTNMPKTEIRNNNVRSGN